MPKQPASSESPWPQFAVGTALFLATAAFVLWQNAHVAVLWDLSYLLDTSWRIANGQVPYRDFPFAHAPLAFLIQAAIIKLTGRVYWHQVLYAAIAGATATVLTWRILLHLLRNRGPRPSFIALLLAATLIPLGIYSIYPHPEYDGDAALFVLIALRLMQHAFDRPRPPAWLCLLAGASTVVPLFAKQNIGIFFFATTIIVVSSLAFAGSKRTPLLIFAGSVIALALALLTVQLTAGLGNYLHWTIAFAAQRRLPGLSLVLGTYHQTSLLWTVPTTLAGIWLLRRHTPPVISTRAQRSGEVPVFPPSGKTLDASPKPRDFLAAHPAVLKNLALTLLAAPFLWVIAQTPFLDDISDRSDALLALWPHLLVLSLLLAAFNLWHLFTRRPPFGATEPFLLLLPLILLATIHGAFLSQQLWGSTYAQWPLLLLLIACLYLTLPAQTLLPLTTVIAATFLLCGTPYALGHDRLGYIHLEGAVAHAQTPALRGMFTPGPWLPMLDELIADTNRTIPGGDSVLLFPGQDPFFYATGRVPSFPVLLFDPATNPYSPAQLAAAVEAQNVRWLILPQQLQLTGKPLDNYDDFVRALDPLFRFDHATSNYSIYRRR